MQIDIKRYSIAAQGAADTHKLGSESDPTGISGVASPMRLVQVSGSFTATIKFQVSNNNSDWVDLLTGITAVGAWEIPAAWPYFRANCTAFSSGPVVVDVSKLLEE